MTVEKSGGMPRRRRHLTPVEKYQVWLEVVTGQGTQREIADRWGVNRTTVVQIVKTAKQGALDRLAASRPGRAGKSAEQVALEEAEGEIARLRETITEQAVELHLHRGKEPWG
jgi:transposase-like protein